MSRSCDNGVRQRLFLPSKVGTDVDHPKHRRQQLKLETTSAIRELHPDAHHTAGFMTTLSIPDFTRGRQSRRLSDRHDRTGLLGKSGLHFTIQHADRLSKSRSEQTGRAFSLPDRSDRLFSWLMPFSLKSLRPLSGIEWALFPEGIGNRVDLQEKSAGLSADRCLNKVRDKVQVLSGYLNKRRDMLSQRRSISKAIHLYFPFIESVLS